MASTGLVAAAWECVRSVTQSSRLVHGSWRVSRGVERDGSLCWPQRTFEIWSFVFAFIFKRVTLNMKFTYWGKFSEAAKKASASAGLCAQ